MPRVNLICRDCRKHKGQDPQNRARCPECLAAYRKKREVTWCKIDLAPTGEIHLCCSKCSKRKFFENHHKPIREKDKDKPTLDRMASAFKVFRREHRSCGVPAKPAKQPKPRKKTAVAS
jgi:hypothetical protein